MCDQEVRSYVILRQPRMGVVRSGLNPNTLPPELERIYPVMMVQHEVSKCQSGVHQYQRIGNSEVVGGFYEGFSRRPAGA